MQLLEVGEVERPPAKREDREGEKDLEPSVGSLGPAMGRARRRVQMGLELEWAAEEGWQQLGGAWLVLRKGDLQGKLQGLGVHRTVHWTQEEPSRRLLGGRR